MKYVVLVPDGAADRPVGALGGVTPLEAAHTPNMDRIAKNGVVGTVQTVPEGAIPGSDVANVSILGYDPLQFYTGRGPLEAGSRGIDLKSSEHAFRCNLITVDGGVLTDYSAG
ncbi:MAG: phosphoglycerate mutase, partial [Terriglobia bacterium]